MRNLLFLILFLSVFFVSAQKEGQSFCEGDTNASYFPLLKFKKFIIWENTYYSEENLGTKTIDGNVYTAYSQSWETGDIVTLFLRNDNASILEYKEGSKRESVRLPEKIKVGYSWKIDNGLVTYEIMSLNDELTTPVCNYKNLLALKSSFQNGEFIFYYLKGYGYIGAKKDGQLISFVVPRSPKELLGKNKTED